MYSVETFPGQQPGEKIVIVLHRHWFVFISRLIRVIIATILPVVAIGIIMSVFNFRLDAGSMSYALVVMTGCIYLLFLLILLYGYWLDYALDVFIVSDKRIVDIEQKGLFNRTVAEERIFRILDVTYEIKGVIPTFFKFGNVYAQSAAERQRFIFEDVPHPDKVSELILHLIDTAKKESVLPVTEAKRIISDPKDPPHHQHPPSAPPAT